VCVAGVVGKREVCWCTGGGGGNDVWEKKGLRCRGSGKGSGKETGVSLALVLQVVC